MSQFEPIRYAELNPRQKENHNFHKIAARLADYGFNCMRLTDDWQGADFIACHIDGETFLKVQLKGRMFIDRKYQGKDIQIAFVHGDAAYYLYDHDRLVEYVEVNGHIREGNASWHKKGIQHWATLPAWAIDFLNDFKI